MRQHPLSPMRRGVNLLIALAGLSAACADDARDVREDADAAGADAARTDPDSSAAATDAEMRDAESALDSAAPERDAAADASATTDASKPDTGPPMQVDAGVITRPCKRGVSYNNERAVDAVHFGPSLSWWYDWAATPASAAYNALSAKGAEFAPMIWSGPPRRNIDVQALIRDIPQGTKYLLGFNEPNFGAQASLTPAQAAAAWPQLEEIARARGLALVSPAVNYCGGDCNQTDPFMWLDQFFAACKGCKVDYVAFHWYACSIEALKSTVTKYKKYGKPLWLTEFACLDDPGDHSAAGQLAYMDKAVPYLESEPQVFRYAWFIGRSSQPTAYALFTDLGLSALGKAYVGYPQSCDAPQR